MLHPLAVVQPAFHDLRALHEPGDERRHLNHHSLRSFRHERAGPPATSRVVTTMSPTFIPSSPAHRPGARSDRSHARQVWRRPAYPRYRGFGPISPQSEVVPRLRRLSARALRCGRSMSRSASPI